MDSLNQIRISQVRASLPLKKKGIMIIDESLLHKSGRCMELAGLHRAYIGHIERGEKNIGLKNLEKIAKGLKVDICVLVNFDSS